MRSVSCLVACGLLAIGILLTPCAGLAEEQPTPETVQFFEAMAGGQISVKVIAKSSCEANVMVTNTSGKPLSVKMPEALAARPVLAQFGQQFGQPPRGNNNFPPAANAPDNKTPQTIGMGFPQLFGPNNMMQQNNFMQNNRMQNNPLFPNNRQNGRNNNMFPPGLFNIAPEQTVKLEATAVCLNHGNPNPRAAIPYEIKPLADVTDKPGVAQVCALLSDPKTDRTQVQLAAWNLANDMSWDKIRAIRYRSMAGFQPRYTEKTLEASKKIAEKALKDAEEAKKANSPAKTS